MSVPSGVDTSVSLTALLAYFDSIATEFEIKERIDAFNKKIDYAQEVQSTLRALLTEVCPFLPPFLTPAHFSPRRLLTEWR